MRPEEAVIELRTKARGNIAALMMGADAIERTKIQKKIVKDSYAEWGHCPECGCGVAAIDKFCRNCGQRFVGTKCEPCIHTDDDCENCR